MAPYKLEDNIREKLEARELKPSSEAWKKLEAKLDAEQPKKKPVLWYYAAASFVGFLILASVFLGRNNTGGINQIVEENPEQVIENESEIIPNNTEVTEFVSDENNSEKETKKKQETNSTRLKTLPKKKSVIDKKIEKSEAIATTSKNENQSKKDAFETNSGLNSEAVAKEEEKLLNNKVDEVVASVKKLQQNNSEVSISEVENLLNSARREIQTQRILNSPKVDATALLQDVEVELEKSFRDKVFDALGEGFQKVRTAVSERND